MKANFRFQIFLATFLFIFNVASNVFSQKITAVTGVSITVEDLEAEVAFFTEILNFKKTGESRLQGRAVADLFGLTDTAVAIDIATLQLGAEQIRLLDFDGVESRPVPRFTRSNDLWFQHLAIVVSDMDAAYRKLLEQGVTHVSTAPQTLPDYLPKAAGIKAFYFRDPEGHNLELIWFPPGKGDPRWQHSSSANQKPSNQTPETRFMGIDNTAIAVSNTARSMAFYRDGLGLVHGGHSENYGTEQEHLNQIFGARLDINGLHADTGFGVEFLRYIAPPGGRPYPSGSSPADLWHYQTELLTDDLPGLIRKLETGGFVKISTAVVEIDGRKLFLLRDPDGHAVLLQQ